MHDRASAAAHGAYRGTQIDQFWMIPDVISVRLTAAQIGGYLKSSVDNAWWAGISAA
jgi:hypothetical protein